jgi:hypothetical protein
MTTLKREYHSHAIDFVVIIVNQAASSSSS